MNSNVDDALNELSQYMYEKTFKELSPNKQYMVRSQARKEGRL